MNSGQPHLLHFKSCRSTSNTPEYEPYWAKGNLVYSITDRIRRSTVRAERQRNPQRPSKAPTSVRVYVTTEHFEVCSLATLWLKGWSLIVIHVSPPDRFAKFRSHSTVTLRKLDCISQRRALLQRNVLQRRSKSQMNVETVYSTWGDWWHRSG